MRINKDRDNILVLTFLVEGFITRSKKHCQRFHYPEPGSTDTKQKCTHNQNNLKGVVFAFVKPLKKTERRKNTIMLYRQLIATIPDVYSPNGKLIVTFDFMIK